MKINKYFLFSVLVLIFSFSLKNYISWRKEKRNATITAFAGKLKTFASRALELKGWVEDSDYEYWTYEDMGLCRDFDGVGVNVYMFQIHKPYRNKIYEKITPMENIEVVDTLYTKDSSRFWVDAYLTTKDRFVLRGWQEKYDIFLLAVVDSGVKIFLCQNCITRKKISLSQKEFEKLDERLENGELIKLEEYYLKPF